MSPERRSGGSSRRQRMRNRSSARFKTQPITFDEIQEVDEDTTPEDPITALKDQFTAFSKSMDGIMSSKSTSGFSSSDDACSGPDGATSLPAPNAAHLAQHERSRSRRLKRRVKKGIAEVPEPDTDSQAG